MRAPVTLIAARVYSHTFRCCLGLVSGNRGLVQGLDLMEGAVLYRTLSACPIATVLDRTGIRWVPARVEQLHNQVYLTVSSPHYGELRTLVCSSAAFFYRVSRRQLRCSEQALHCTRWLGMVTSNSRMVEKIKQEAATIRQRSTVFDFPLFEQGALVSDERIAEVVQEVEGTNLILRAQTKVCADVPAINAKLLHLVEVAKGRSIIADMPHDRLIALSHLDDSALLKRCITPAVTYFLRSGDERQCHSELVSVISALARISGIDFHVTIHVERPWPPEIGLVLDMLRKHHDAVRVVRLVLSRPQQEVLDAAAAQRRRQSSNTTPFSPSPDVQVEANVDFFTLIEHISSASADGPGSITSNDFCALSASTLLEPLLKKVHHNTFKIRPCDPTGAMCVLIPAKDGGNFPLNRCVDVDSLITALEPLCSESGPSTTVGMVSHARQAFKQNLRSKREQIFGLSELMAESANLRSVLNLMSRSQILIVNRGMDLAALDLEHILSPVECSRVVEQVISQL